MCVSHQSHVFCFLIVIYISSRGIKTGFIIVAGIAEEEKKRLLHSVVIGGGPTGVEFSGELSDFITRDVEERFSHVKDHIGVTIIEVYTHRLNLSMSEFHC